MQVDGSSNSGQGGSGDDAVLRKKATEAAQKFEAFFIKQMMSQMRAGARTLASDDSPLKNKVNEDMLDMADGLVADSLSQQRAFGIADLLLRQILPPAGPAHLSPAAARSPSPSSTVRNGTEGTTP